MSSGHYCDDCHQNYLHCTCGQTPLVGRLEGSYTVQEQEAGERIRRLENALECLKKYVKPHMEYNALAVTAYYIAVEGLRNES